jgi:hypothetical protein
MRRVLDLDLDFFVHGAVHWRESTDARLSDSDYPAWTEEEALAFLRDRSGLTTPLPGIVVEHHGDPFGLWHEAIEGGRLLTPFSLTHVDSHADLGMGDDGYVDLLSRVLHEEPERRRNPGSRSRTATSSRPLPAAAGFRISPTSTTTTAVGPTCLRSSWKASTQKPLISSSLYSALPTWSGTW